MRAGIIWLVLGLRVVDGVETVMVLEARVGVVRLTAGRARSAGLMSGILWFGWGLRESSAEAGAIEDCGGRTEARRHAVSLAGEMPTASRQGRD